MESQGHYVDLESIKFDTQNNKVIVPLNIVYEASEFKKIYPQSLLKGDKEKTFNFCLKDQGQLDRLRNQSQHIYKEKQLAIENKDSNEDPKYTTPQKQSKSRYESKRSNTESKDASIQQLEGVSDDESEFIEIQDSSI